MLARYKFQIKPLVNEILDHLPKSIWESNTTTFLDPAMGGGQFAIEIERRLRKYGHSNENIHNRVFGFEQTQLIVNYAVNSKKLVGTYASGNFLEINYNMKFDVVVGNPPYADSANNPLYYKFHNIIMKQVLSQNGYLAFITPDAMASGIESGTIKGCHDVEKGKILLINTSSSIKKLSFPNIGISNFCYYIIQNSTVISTNYIIINDTDTFIGRFNLLKPVVFNAIVSSILSKCFTFNKNYYNGSWATIGKSAIINQNGSDKVALRLLPAGKIETYNVDIIKKHKLHGLPKVFVSGFGNNAIPCYDHTLVCAIEKLIYTVPTESDLHSENLVKLLDCNLQKFLARVIKARGPYIDFLRHFNGVSIATIWSNDELYAHFNLTQDEIDYIEKLLV